VVLHESLGMFQESIRFIERVEKERYAYRHAAMPERGPDEELFDLTFNRSHFTTEMIVDVIMLAIEEKKILEGYTPRLDFL
ncbi:MAG TPA: hypothetical protein PKJ58_03980, partial [Prolixibacteraceae bacterium]|nr:hypothetical protein [Prolixibacteraceae bacterium]